MKKLTLKLLQCMRAGDIWHFFMPKPCVAILAYHRVSPFSADQCLMRDMVVEPSAFEQQIRFLAEHYDVISLSQWLLKARGELKPTSRYVIVTFDDAYADNYRFAFPILKKYNIPATVFVPTHFVEHRVRFWWERLAFLLSRTERSDVTLEMEGESHFFRLSNWPEKKILFDMLSRKLKQTVVEEKTNEVLEDLRRRLDVQCESEEDCVMTWDQAGEMEASGITFGNHSHSHRVLSRLDGNELVKELRESRSILAKRVSNPIGCFAYPYGNVDDFNRETGEAIAREGYTCAVTMRQGINVGRPDLFLLRRIGIGGNDSFDMFRLKVAGLISWISSWKTKS